MTVPAIGILSDLDRLLAEARVLAGGVHPCAVLGHDWIFAGGAHCGCEDGACSVAVLKCSACGDCDYGDNEESRNVRENCARLNGDRP